MSRIFLVLTLSMCFVALDVFSQSHETKNTAKRTILGSWYLSTWTNYHKLFFHSNSVVDVAGVGDTSYAFKYRIMGSNLRLVRLVGHDTTHATIVKLDADSLLIKGLLNTKEVLRYSRVKLGK